MSVAIKKVVLCVSHDHYLLCGGTGKDICKRTLFGAANEERWSHAIYVGVWAYALLNSYIALDNLLYHSAGNLFFLKKGNSTLDGTKKGSM